MDRCKISANDFRGVQIVMLNKNLHYGNIIILP